MKICYVIDGLPRGGKERQLLELIKGLIRNCKINPQNILLLSFLHNGHLDQFFKDLGINFKYVNRKFRWDFFAIFQVYKIIKEFDPDFVHIWDSMTALFTIPVAKSLGIKIIDGSIRSAAPLRRFSKLWLFSKLTYPFSDYLIANSYAGLKSRKLELSINHLYVHNGFDAARISDLDKYDYIRNEFNIKTKYVIGMVANFVPSKDYISFIKAANEILKLRNDVTFLTIGDGPNIDICKKMVPGGQKEYLKFLGRRSDVESIVNTFDISVLTSNTTGHAEGISNSIMEYMVLGKPVIATDSGGNRELIIDRETGFIINAFDTDKLVELILKLLDNPELRKSMGMKGKERILNNFSMDRMVNDYMNLYKKAIKKG